MVEVVCLSHAGIRCAIPSRLIAKVGRVEADIDTVELWPAHTPSAGGSTRLFDLVTGSGRRVVAGSDPTVVRLDPRELCPVSPLLRRFLTLPHVVGSAELDTYLVWLVDPLRLHAPLNFERPQAENED
jgi:hypothetical protein